MYSRRWRDGSRGLIEGKLLNESLITCWAIEVYMQYRGGILVSKEVVYIQQHAEFIRERRLAMVLTLCAGTVCFEGRVCVMCIAVCLHVICH